MAEVSAPPVSELTYCTVHKDVETALRCNKCGRYMCTKCARRTPVGYRCKECVSNQQAIFYNSQTLDPLIQFGVSFGLGLVGAVLVGLLLGNLGLFAFLIGIPASVFAAGLICGAAHRVVGRRRSRYTWSAVAAGIVTSALVVAAGPILFTLLALGPALTDPSRIEGGGSLLPFMFIGGFTNVGWWIYIVVATANSVRILRFGK